MDNTPAVTRPPVSFHSKCFPGIDLLITQAQNHSSIDDRFPLIWAVGKHKAKIGMTQGVRVSLLTYFTLLYPSSSTILGVEGRKRFLSSVFLSHPRSRSSLVFPLPCTLTFLCCKLYWQADEVPCASGAQTIWFSPVGCGGEFQSFLWSWCSWPYRVWFCWRLSLDIAPRRWWSFFRDFW